MNKKTKSKDAETVKKQAPTPVKNAVPGSGQDYAAYTKLLMDLRQRVAGGLEHLEEEALKKSQRDSTGDLSGYSLHMADVATDNFDMEFNLNLASSEQQYLNLIDQALLKIKEGVYGTCDDCAKPIPSKRLMAMPFARLCISCQELEEKNPRPRS